MPKAKQKPSKRPADFARKAIGVGKKRGKRLRDAETKDIAAANEPAIVGKCLKPIIAKPR